MSCDQQKQNVQSMTYSLWGGTRADGHSAAATLSRFVSDFNLKAGSVRDWDQQLRTLLFSSIFYFLFYCSGLESVQVIS